jgi:hypothetical protein
MTETTTTENIVFTPDGGMPYKNIEKKEDKLCPQCYKQYLADQFKVSKEPQEIYREIEHFRCLKALKPSSIDANKVYLLKEDIKKMMNEYKYMNENDTDQLIFNKLTDISNVFNEYILTKTCEERWHESMRKQTIDLLKMVLGVEFDTDFSLLS